jgi:hypothetical protein
MRKLVVLVAAVWLGLVPAVRAQQFASPVAPASPAEIANALRDYRDGLSALKTLERVIEDSAQKRLEGLLARGPQFAFVAPSFSMAPAAAASFGLGAGPTPLGAFFSSAVAQQASPFAAQASVGGLEARLDQLERSIERLTRVVGRLEDRMQIPERPSEIQPKRFERKE